MMPHVLVSDLLWHLEMLDRWDVIDDTITAMGKINEAIQDWLKQEI